MEDRFFALIIIITVLAFAVIGAGSLLMATTDITVINNCKSQGWHNFGQTRIICSVEPKKEVK